MKRWIWIIIGVTGLVAVTSAYIYKPPIANHTEVRSDSAKVESASPKILYYGYSLDQLNLIHGKIRRDENLAMILKNHHVAPSMLYDLSLRSKNVFDIRKLGAYKPYDLLCERDSLSSAVALIYYPNDEEYVVFHLEDSAFVSKFDRKITLQDRIATGTIQNSLAETIDAMGLSPQFTNDLADIFAWEIDFFHLYPGDRFKVLYKEKLVDGKPIGMAGIDAAVFEHDKNETYAFHFSQYRKADYFDEKGRSLKKTLLRYPVKFSRISSRYSGRRFHPVQKRYKAHRGTDFAAPQWTPIRSVGDGMVVDARYGKYNGNFVKIRHNSTYSTQYLHMVKIARGIKKGVKVRQGQTIGFVGHTGLARGNHVCYRFWKFGRQVDALQVKIPSSHPVTSEDMMDYQLKAEELKTRLDQITFPAAEPELFSGK